MSKLLRDTWLLFRRSFREGLRNPTVAFLVPTLVPAVMIVLTSQTFGAVVHLPHFPTKSYLTLEVPGIVMLTAMMGAGYSATAMVVDVQSGYLDRLRVLPVRPAAVVLGRLLFDAMRAIPGGILVIVISVAMGSELRGGLPGVVAILALLALWALAYNGLFYVVGLRTRNAQAPFGMLPIFVPIMFLTTIFSAPFMQPRWVRVIAAWNPLTYLINGARVFVSDPFSWVPVGKAVAVCIGLLATTWYAAGRAFAALLRDD
jgi:ABC-2 type transport system permease protein